MQNEPICVKSCSAADCWFDQQVQNYVCESLNMYIKSYLHSQELSRFQVRW